MKREDGSYVPSIPDTYPFLVGFGIGFAGRQWVLFTMAWLAVIIMILVASRFRAVVVFGVLVRP